MTKALTDAELGWVAGVIDTRGYFSDRPSSHADRRLPTLSVGLGDVDGEPHPIVTRLCALTGVAPIRYGKGFNRASCGTHCPEPHIHVTGHYHRWIVGGAKAIVVLAAVRDHLVVKQQETQNALRLRAQYKAAHYAEMVRLGWPVVGS